MKTHIIILTLICSTLSFSSCGSHNGPGNQGAAVSQPAPAKDSTIVDAQPVPIKTVQPKYPELMRKAGVQGTVWLSVLVGEKGNVKEIKILKVSSNLKSEGTPGGLPEAAIDAVKQWEFKPAQLNGKAVAVWVAIPVAFKLDDKKK